MSGYDDYDGPPRRRRTDRPPYPADPEEDFDRRSRPAKADATAGSQVGKSGIPPPPLGSAMKSDREGSRSRVPSHIKPDFPDEASYLNPRSHDAERKDGDRDRKFRERRDGYGNEESEHMRGDMRRQRSQRDAGGRARPAYDDSRSETTLPVRGGPPRDRRGDDAYDRRSDRDDRRRPPRDYDDRPRQRRDYDDDATDLHSRRKGPRTGVEYGADPIRPVRRSETDRRDDRGRRDRYDDYSDDDDDYRSSRRKSQPAPRRAGGKSDDDDYYDRRRRDDDRDPRRRPQRRRSHDDYDDYYDRKDRRDRRDDKDPRDSRDKRREPTHMKIGKVDIGPALDKGQKYYGSLAPILTPIVMNYLKNKK